MMIVQDMRMGINQIEEIILNATIIEENETDDYPRDNYRHNDRYKDSCREDDRQDDYRRDSRNNYDRDYSPLQDNDN